MPLRSNAAHLVSGDGPGAVSGILTATLGIALAGATANPAWLGLSASSPATLAFGEALKWVSGIFGNVLAEKWSSRARSRLPNPRELVRNHDLERLSARALQTSLRQLAGDPDLGWTDLQAAALGQLAGASESGLMIALAPAADQSPLDVSKVLARVARQGTSRSEVEDGLPADLDREWTRILRRLYVETGVRFPGESVDQTRLVAAIDGAYWPAVRELLKHDGTGQGPLGGKAYRALEIQTTAWLVVLARQNRRSLRTLTATVQATSADTQARLDQVLSAVKAQETAVIDALAAQIKAASDDTSAALRTQTALFRELGAGLDHLVGVVVDRLDRIEALQRELLAESQRRQRLELPATASAVLDYLTATGHRRVASQTEWSRNEDGSTDLLVERPDGSQVWYCSVEGWATEHHVNRLASRTEGVTMPRVMVTSQLIIDGVIDYATGLGLRLTSLRSFVAELLGLGDYARMLSQLARDRVGDDGWFVEPRFSVRSNVRDELDRTIVTGLDGFLEEWLRDSTPEAVALLGDYGAGKSTVVSRWVRNHFRDFGRPGDRLPILLRAADRREVGSFDEMIAAFGERTGSRLGDPAVFRALANAGRLVVVFDGLDELVVGGTGDVVRALWTLAEGIDHRTKLVVTCRANAFENRDEEARATGQPGALMNRFAFWRIRLEPFDESHVRAYLAKRLPADADDVAAIMFNAYDLMNLASRPVLLEMIVSNWDEVKREAAKTPGRPIEVGDLYRVYTDRWLRRAARGDAQLTPDQRIGVMIRIATWMAGEKRAEMPVAQLADRIAEALGPEYRRRDRALEQEVRLQSFLVRSADDQYFFAHRSFEEYFLSMEVAREIGAERPVILAATRLQPEIVQFVSAHHPDAAAVWRLLEQSRSTPEASVLNGNLLSVLRDLGVDFSGRDLRRLHATGADFSATKFVGARLDGCVLADCNVRNADFSGAVLAGGTLTDLNIGVRSAAKCVRFRADSAEVLASDGAGNVLRLPLPGGEPIRVHRHDDSITAVATTAASTVVASGGFDGKVRITELGEGPTRMGASHGAVVYGVAVRPGGLQIASTDSKGRLKLWDREKGGVVLDKQFHDDTAYTVEWSPTGDWLAVASFDHRVSVWRFANPTTVRVVDQFAFSDHQARVNGIRFTPCGRFVAAASSNGSVRIWSLTERAVVAHLQGQRGTGFNEWAVAFSPDGGTLASAGADGVIRLWDWRAGGHRPLPGHDTEIWSLDYDPSGRFLASGSFDGRVRVWEVGSGAVVAEWAFGTSEVGIKMSGADLRGVTGLSALQERVLRQAGASF